MAIFGVHSPYWTRLQKTNSVVLHWHRLSSTCQASKPVGATKGSVCSGEAWDPGGLTSWSMAAPVWLPQRSGFARAIPHPHHQGKSGQPLQLFFCFRKAHFYPTSIHAFLNNAVTNSHLGSFYFLIFAILVNLANAQKQPCTMGGCTHWLVLKWNWKLLWTGFGLCSIFASQSAFGEESLKNRRTAFSRVKLMIFTY